MCFVGVACSMPPHFFRRNTQYLVVILVVILGYNYISEKIMSSKEAAADTAAAAAQQKQQQEEAADPPRNFTAQQLKYFDGRKDKDGVTDKPLYMSVAGTVFDVSTGRDFYGPDGPYGGFAGRECGVALAKFDFSEEWLDIPCIYDELNFSEKLQLDNWVEKFTYYRQYPIKGKMVHPTIMPDPEREISMHELAKYKGETQLDADTKKEILPKGYAVPPIYVGAGDQVFDMSFGGSHFYGPGGPYNKFAGRNASRALGKMSLDDADLDNWDIADLDEKQLKIMNDWIKTFSEQKGYPVVGKLKKV
jgi:membrane-associated progesterone receptor component